MPEGQVATGGEDQHRDGFQTRADFTADQDESPVPAVDQGAGERAQQQAGAHRKKGHQGESRGLSGDLPGPETEGKTGQSTASDGDNLAEPGDGETDEPGQQRTGLPPG